MSARVGNLWKMRAEAAEAKLERLTPTGSKALDNALSDLRKAEAKLERVRSITVNDIRGVLRIWGIDGPLDMGLVEDMDMAVNRIHRLLTERMEGE